MAQPARMVLELGYEPTTKGHQWQAERRSPPSTAGHRSGCAPRRVCCCPHTKRLRAVSSWHSVAADIIIVFRFGWMRAGFLGAGRRRMPPSPSPWAVTVSALSNNGFGWVAIPMPAMLGWVSHDHPLVLGFRGRAIIGSIIGAVVGKIWENIQHSTFNTNIQ